MKTLFTSFLVLFSSVVTAATPRTVFVQLFEWPWNDVAKECEVNLGPNGFSAVQVSPPQEHLVWEGSPWWERYQPISYTIFSRSGDEAEFRNMVKRCNAANVDVYVDVVFNHMAGIEDGRGILGTTFTHYEYPNLYSYQDFHHCGRNGNNDIKNFYDLYELQNCELVNLADLKTESVNVQNKIASYLNRLIDMGVRGFRIDAAKHIPANDIKSILDKTKKPVYIIQELITSSNDPFNINDYTKVGDITAYAYPYMIGQVFKSKKFDSIFDLFKYLPDSSDSVVFIDNHDLQRSNDRSMLLSANYDKEIFDLAQVFMLTYPFGYPQLYSSYKFSNYNQGPPVDAKLMTLPMLDDQANCISPFLCEHKRAYVNNLVKFRNKADKAFYVSNWWTNGSDQLAFSRGDLGFVIINNSNQDINRRFQTGLKGGLYCNIGDIKNPNCTSKIKVDKNGYANIFVESMNALVIQ
ncbi:MAG: carbohydrate-binding module family 20 domain-containing protein [Bdellovibrio sp.]